MCCCLEKPCLAPGGAPPRSTRIKVKHWTTLGYICCLWSFTMISCMLLSHASQAVQTSRFSTARVPMNTCRMWYTKRFWKNVVCSCNFVICTIKYTHTCALRTGFKLVYIYTRIKIHPQKYKACWKKCTHTNGKPRPSH
jgi:hypothetical protein